MVALMAKVRKITCRLENDWYGLDDHETITDTYSSGYVDGTSGGNLPSLKGFGGGGGFAAGYGYGHGSGTGSGDCDNGKLTGWGYGFGDGEGRADNTGTGDGDDITVRVRNKVGRSRDN